MYPAGLFIAWRAGIAWFVLNAIMRRSLAARMVTSRFALDAGTLAALNPESVMGEKKLLKGKAVKSARLQSIAEDGSVAFRPRGVIVCLVRTNCPTSL
ncbi:hypothetical protein KCP73_20940 [Salmonella enterica subsp. enterica]|nr:hypothetical protein KCP73_20940 [Salmonella enterica subsp. enterica]